MGEDDPGRTLVAALGGAEYFPFVVILSLSLGLE